MAHIIEQTPKPFWTAHPDWLQNYPQKLKDIAHYTGLAAAKRYYVECEAKAVAIDAKYPLDFILNPFTWIQDYLINIERDVYHRNFQIIYEDAALAQCKLIERAETVLNEATERAKQFVEQLNTYTQDNFIKPLKDQVAALKPQIDQFKRNLSSLSQQANSAISSAESAIGKANSALSGATSALSQAVDAKNLSDSANKAVSDAQTKIQQAFEELSAKSKEINNLAAKAQDLTGKAQKAAEELSSHKIQISDLYQKLSDLSGQQVTPPNQSSSFLSELKEQIKKL